MRCCKSTYFCKRGTVQEEADDFTYTANALNQYTQITENAEPFAPEFDADGNQTRIKTTTGIWTAIYNALNRPVTYTRENEDGTLTVITADYDYMGRRVFKKVETVTPAAPDTENGEDGDTPTETRTILTNHRFLYRGYLQIAALNLSRSTLNDLWLITWDPTETVATRPLAIQQSGTWYIYGTDLLKNVTELYSTSGYIHTTYTYSPYGLVTSSGNVTQPLQWSSEYADTDLGLIYYNYRHYNPLDGRWTGRDPMAMKEKGVVYGYIQNNPMSDIDYLGLILGPLFGQNQSSPQPPPDPEPEQQNNDGCTDAGLSEPGEQAKAKCQKYVDQAMGTQRIKDIMKLLSENSCAIPAIECKCCKNNCAGAGGWHFPAYKDKPGKIVMCTNGRLSESRAVDFLGHELTHRLQSCQGRMEGGCLQVLELEIEAYKTHISECDRIMPKAIWSASKSAPCINTGLTDEIVEKATEYCNKLN